MVEEKIEKTKKPKSSEREQAENIESLVVELAKKGYSPAKIGDVLKEKYNIPKIKILGKKVTKILKENNIKYQNDLALVNKRIKKLEVHYSKNKQDKKAGREIVRLIGLKKRLEKYENRRK